jgi:PPOX class probable F420-dependent enzyme
VTGVAPAADHINPTTEELPNMTESQNPNLVAELMALLRAPSTCYITTLMPDGSPQLTQTWVDTDGDHILINSVVGYQKLRNVERDPRVAVAVSTPSSPTRYITVRGHVTATTTDGAADHIEALAQKYLGTPYPWYGGRDQTRATITIAIDKIHAMGQ